MRLLMLGLDNAGKTTVVKKFNGEDIDQISPTLGFNIKTLEYRGYKLNVWDVGGCERATPHATSTITHVIYCKLPTIAAVLTLQPATTPCLCTLPAAKPRCAATGATTLSRRTA